MKSPYIYPIAILGHGIAFLLFFLALNLDSQEVGLILDCLGWTSIGFTWGYLLGRTH